MTTPISGQQFDPDEDKLLQETAESWRKVWNEMPVQALTRIEDAAKQMIVVTTGLQGLYVAIFAFSNIRTQVMATLGMVPGLFILLLFFTPLVCWLMSLLNATRVFVPRVQPDINLNELSMGAWVRIREAYGGANEKKLYWLHCSHRWLIASFVLILIAIWTLVFLPTVPTEPMQIIIVTPTSVVAPRLMH